ncbi:MAG: UDP-N-acetylmuramyl-tripeptide synthetase [Microgenomates group bacterium GW2011_GWA1_46_15]|nr:MAG: UDP-N-acetylmuramyl-tripeptide synthetase [Microgenomates group bacterium GW2011_GWB1_45_17]KKU23277.1 MAG: UDP-N-acetylmuramyl-tripeptide synthetase [Microgenomates group bacterium GW2011_GWA1_46_15]KKU23446.1 MAG: UDP-MurNac-tripeptide synthetase [Microgenomates group bacterium GW2011_GWC1_46_15]
MIWYGFPARRLTIIGVTGTDGKTTTATMVYHVLKHAGKKVALISTVSAYMGDEEIDTGFHVTTPEQFPFQRLLRRIVNSGHTHVVLEVTSHGIAQHRIFGIRPTIAILTNITHEHLDYHGSYAAYLKTKARFLSRAKTAIINHDDSSFDEVKAYIKKHSWNTRIVPYAYRLLDAQSKRIVLDRFPEGYNRQNGAAVITAAEYLHLPLAQTLDAIKRFPSVLGRMQEVPNTRGLTLIVDFAHTPNALEHALKALRGGVKSGKKLIAVCGAAGLRDAMKRPMMGKIAAELADEIVFTAEDPRIEDVNVIIRQMKEGVRENHGHVHELADRRTAIRFAIQTLARPGDTIGIFGKGHETSMNLDGKHEVPWSDAEEARLALEGI